MINCLYTATTPTQGAEMMAKNTILILCYNLRKRQNGESTDRVKEGEMLKVVLIGSPLVRDFCNFMSAK